MKLITCLAIATSTSALKIAPNTFAEVGTGEKYADLIELTDHMDRIADYQLSEDNLLMLLMHNYNYGRIGKGKVSKASYD